jgi:RND family efflux transporter MFP subunit
MSLRLQFVFVALLAGVLAAGWVRLVGWEGAAKSPLRTEPRPSATLVLVEALGLAEDRVVVSAIGTGEALRSASIYPTVAGEVIEVLFDAAQWVEKGAPLIRLDDKHERLAVRLAEVAEADGKRRVRRLEKLAPSGSVAVVRLEEAQAEFESVSLRLDQAKAALEDRTVFAPFAGFIGLTEIDVGDRVTEDTLIATLDDRSVILVEFDVPEDYAGRIKLGDAVLMRPWSEPDRALTGTVSATNSRIDPITRSLRVKARLANREDTIRPGTSFEVRLAFTGSPHPSVPEVAVLWSRDGAYLWRVAGGKAEKVFVKIVRRDDGRILVEGSLQLGDLIVVEGVQGLRHGQTVEPAPFGDG